VDLQAPITNNRRAGGRSKIAACKHATQMKFSKTIADSRYSEFWLRSMQIVFGWEQKEEEAAVTVSEFGSYKEKFEPQRSKSLRSSASLAVAVRLEHNVHT